MKKQKLFFAASLTLLLGLGIVSCNKQEAQPSTTTAAKHSTAMSTSEDIGTLHNEGLDYYLANADFSDPKGYITPLTIKYAALKGYDEKAVTTMLADPTVSTVINSEDGLSELGAYFTTHSMKTESGFLTSITRAIASASTPDEVAKSLDVIGTSVTSSKDLSDDGKTTLLGAISVGKASSGYWYDQEAAGVKSPWVIGIAYGKEPLAMPDFSWRKFFAQDIAGAWVGGLFGGPEGLVAGAVGASLAEAVGQLTKE